MQRFVLSTREANTAPRVSGKHDHCRGLTLADRLGSESGAPCSVLQEVIDIAAPHPRDLSHTGLAAADAEKLEAHLERRGGPGANLRQTSVARMLAK